LVFKFTAPKIDLFTSAVSVFNCLNDRYIKGKKKSVLFYRSARVF